MPAFISLRPRQNGRHFADDPFKRIFVNETLSTSIEISLNFVPKGPINNIPALVQIMVWRRRGDKPLSEPMMVSLLTHICVTRPQWVKLQTYMRYICPKPTLIINCETCAAWLFRLRQTIRVPIWEPLLSYEASFHTNQSKHVITNVAFAELINKGHWSTTNCIHQTFERR